MFNIFRKRLISSLMYFRNYGIPKTWLDKCLKSSVSEDPLTRPMVNGSKY